MIDNPKQLKRLYWLSFSLGLVWITYLCLNSPGVYLHDEIGHFLISKNSWKYPELMLDLWGRPIRTILYMIPSIWGLNAARFFSIIIACLTILFTKKVAQKLDAKLLFLIPIFLFFQPWFSDFSYGVITEVPFALFLILGTYLWLDKHEVMASIPIGLLPLIRYEGVAITLLWLVYVLYKRKWKASAISVFPLIIFNLIYYLVFHNLAIEIYFSFKPNTHNFAYGNGTWFHFVRPVLKKGVKIPLLLLTLFGLIPILRLKGKFFIFSGYIIYFLIHTVIYRFGLFGSGGYYIFLLPLAPAFAIAAILGTEFIISSVDKISVNLTSPTISKVFHNLLIASIVISVVYVGLQTKPRPLGVEGVALKQASDWLRSSNLVDNKVISTHVWFFYYYDLAWEPDTKWASPPPLEQLPVGTIVVWDQKYSNPWGLSYDQLSDPKNNWTRLNSFGDEVAIIFQKSTD